MAYPKLTLIIGLRAYNCAPQHGINAKPILTIIDYTKPSYEKRLWVIDMRTNKVLRNELVTHGIGSGNRIYANHFSDKLNSHASSIGVYLTGETYYGLFGYSLRLYGLDKGFNEHAYERNIVIHSYDHVSEKFAKKNGYIDRTWGCPALNKKHARKIINKIKDGSLLICYYPDKKWLKNSDFLG